MTFKERMVRHEEEDKQLEDILEKHVRIVYPSFLGSGDIDSFGVSANGDDVMVEVLVPSRCGCCSDESSHRHIPMVDLDRDPNVVKEELEERTRLKEIADKKKEKAEARAKKAKAKRAKEKRDLAEYERLSKKFDKK